MPMNLTVPKIEVINDKPVQTIAPNGTAGRVGVIADLGDMGVNEEATVEEKINALSRYNVYLIDACDGYLDAELSESYIMMLYNMMTVLKVEQCFVISHHVTEDNCSNIIHVLDVSKEISK